MNTFATMSPKQLAESAGQHGSHLFENAHAQCKKMNWPDTAENVAAIAQALAPIHAQLVALQVGQK